MYRRKAASNEGQRAIEHDLSTRLEGGDVEHLGRASGDVLSSQKSAAWSKASRTEFCVVCDEKLYCYTALFNSLRALCAIYMIL